jgi:transglutaminase-like putative cysteine protease
MKLKITKETLYTYEDLVSLSPHTLRIYPRVDLHFKVDQFHLQSNSDAQIQYRRDLHDNLVAYCFYPNTSNRLGFRTTIELSVKEKNPFQFLLDSHGLKIPCHYKDEELAVLAPYITMAENAKLPSPLAPTIPRPTVETLVNINSWIFENIAYERRESSHRHTAAEILKRGSGSCRDFSTLLAETLRQNGLATRLASGFVWEGDKPKEEKKASSSMHAWVETYLPGAGWIGMDPTNGVLCDHHFVTTAVGRTESDIAPVNGSYYSNKPVTSSLVTRLFLEKLD